MRRTHIAFAAALATAVLAAPVSAQAPRPEDVKAEVPALTAMHEVIMPLWHEAWPNKDYKALVELLPQIEKHLKEIERAELPGILRDKRGLWSEGLVALRKVVADYRSAAQSGNHDALLKEAERLHGQYESLVKVVRPVLKEMDDFHGTLYVLYHYQLNPLQLAPAAESVKALKEKMGPLNAAVLPDRLKDRAPAFEAQRARLSKAVDRLVELFDGRDEIRIKEAIELMHMEYEKLERVFE
ncbi:MAG: hypothetical protein AB1806_12620 [Acidobacteriota bacterium]